MSITAASLVIGVAPRISRADFAAYLTSISSPAAAEAGAGWDALTTKQVDPLFSLGIFQHESGCATNPNSEVVQHDLRNPADDRTVNAVAGTIVSTDRGNFVQYATWTDGWADFAARITDPTYVYAKAGATTPATIIPILAPSSDGNDPTGYVTAVVAFMNAHQSQQGQPTQQGAAMPRIIISAGHENIGQITADKIGQSSADQLRAGTGALGEEAKWNGPWADALVAKLTALGVDAVRTDAIYHADVYGPDADLCLFGHCDGVDPARAQWCMAGPVLSGTETQAADNRASAFVAVWNQVYPGLVGIPNDGPITNDMTYYYGGWYRSNATPAVLIEHFILGEGGQWSTALTPEQGAAADAAAIAQFFGLKEARLEQAAPTTYTDPVTGYQIVYGMLARYQQLKAALDMIHPGEILLVVGRPVENEHADADGITRQKFEHVTMTFKKGQSPDRFDILEETINPYTPVTK